MPTLSPSAEASAGSVQSWRELWPLKTDCASWNKWLDRLKVEGDHDRNISERPKVTTLASFEAHFAYIQRSH